MHNVVETITVIQFESGIVIVTGSRQKSTPPDSKLLIMHCWYDSKMAQHLYQIYSAIAHGLLVEVQVDENKPLLPPFSYATGFCITMKNVKTFRRFHRTWSPYATVAEVEGPSVTMRWA